MPRISAASYRFIVVDLFESEVEASPQKEAETKHICIAAA
jgi:hypothetical protein